MRPVRFAILTLLLIAPSLLEASEPSIESMLPAACVAGWTMDGKVSTYTRENLYRHIDGEAELYMPYGFRTAAAAVYARPGEKDDALAVTLFEMGSLLDAYGIYTNYRHPASEPAGVGAEGFVEESQLMFFQDRYFVQIMTSGSLSQEPRLFEECAEAISRSLPRGSAKPEEAGYLRVPGLVPLTEKYYADGLLGYGTFGRGLTGEVTLGERRVKVFVILGDSEEAIRRLLDWYRKYLGESKSASQISGDGRVTDLRANDPLYKGVLLRQSGRHAVGVTGIVDEWSQGSRLIGQLIERLPASPPTK